MNITKTFGKGTLNSDSTRDDITTALRDVADDLAALNISVGSVAAPSAAGALTSSQAGALTSSQNATTTASDPTTTQALANALKTSYNAAQVDIAALRTAYNAAQVDIAALRTTLNLVITALTAVNPAGGTTIKTLKV
jgi:hypothetical protein